MATKEYVLVDDLNDYFQQFKFPIKEVHFSLSDIFCNIENIKKVKLDDAIPKEWIKEYQERHIGQWSAISIDCMLAEWERYGEV